MDEFAGLADERRRVAAGILADLRLVERWTGFGRPVCVGAYAYDLMRAPDIDMEIYCPGAPRVEDGFSVLRDCAAGNPRVTQALFINALDGQDQALYWQLRYRASPEGEEWKIDMWSAPEDYPLPRAERLVEPMRQALTPELRGVILRLKAELAGEPSIQCPSICLYRAVISEGITELDALRNWLEEQDVTELSDWRP